MKNVYRTKYFSISGVLPNANPASDGRFIAVAEVAEGGSFRENARRAAHDLDLLHDDGCHRLLAGPMKP